MPGKKEKDICFLFPKFSELYKYHIICHQWSTHRFSSIISYRHSSRPNCAAWTMHSGNKVFMYAMEVAQHNGEKYCMFPLLQLFKSTISVFELAYGETELQRCTYHQRLQSKGLLFDVDIKNAFKLHPSCRLDKERRLDGGKQLSEFWVHGWTRSESHILHVFVIQFGSQRLLKTAHVLK